MTRATFSAAASAVVILVFCLTSAARAAVPDSLSYQGYLTDASGAAIDGSAEMLFTIYSVPTTGAPLWSSGFLAVPVEQGLFSVQLGGFANPFPPTLFNTPLWVGVTIRGEAEMVPRRPLTTVGFSFKADDALSLQGQGPAVFDQSGHVADTANPHAVTALQVDAATLADIADLQAQLDTALVSIVSLQESMGAAEDAVVANAAAIAAETSARISADAFESEVRANADFGHDSAIADIQANTVLALDGVLTRPDNQTALFSAVNVQVVNGTGSTDGTPTGTGNIIVGYNTADTDAPICSLGGINDPIVCAESGGVWASSHKSGSHNVVIGNEHNYSRFGGLVAGSDNNITGDWASVSGGSGNSATGRGASVSGGSANTASGIGAAVGGGNSNDASGITASVSGGELNIASHNNSSVSGGVQNTASQQNSSVSGGAGNTASGFSASVSGGAFNNATGDRSSISGGENSTASGAESSVSGGESNIASGEAASVSGGTVNQASNDNSSISGGFNNTASGSHSSISGGDSNTASSFAASVSGGFGNTASATVASVSGGWNNAAVGGILVFAPSVSGGQNNTASGDYASVSGGQNNVASGSWSSISGGGSSLAQFGNEAYADHSSILGGIFNKAGAPASGDPSLGAISAICGGDTNQTTGVHSVVAGGRVNIAAGFGSIVSGGNSRTASGTDDWVAGALFQDN